MKKTKKAFSLIEIVIVLGILLSTSLFVMPISINELRKQKSSDEAKNISSNIFLAQQNAYSGLNDKDYGVAFFSNRYEIYSGDSYTTGGDVFYLPNDIGISSINFNGSNVLHFDKGNFKPNFAGSLRVYNANSTYQININTEGLITYVKI